MLKRLNMFDSNDRIISGTRKFILKNYRKWRICEVLIQKYSTYLGTL